MSAAAVASARRAIALPGRVPQEAEPVASVARPRLWRRVLEPRSARVAAATLLLLVAASFLGPALLPWSPEQVASSGAGASAPSLQHPLGTDPVGRDVLVRTLAAGRVSFAIGFFVAIATTAFAALVGGAAAWFGGWWDASTTWLLDVLMSIPALPMLVAMSVLVATPGSHVGAIVRAMPEPVRIGVVLSLLGWMGTARLVRALVLSLRREPYVEAARALGAGNARILLRHLVPQAMPLLGLFGTLAVAGAIGAETFLSFLGMGVSPPTPTWGNMVDEAATLTGMLRQPWALAGPVLAVFATILALNVLAESMRVALGSER